MCHVSMATAFLLELLSRPQFMMYVHTSPHQLTAMSCCVVSPRLFEASTCLCVLLFFALVVFGCVLLYTLVFKCLVVLMLIATLEDV